MTGSLAQASPGYFLVSEIAGGPHGDSYILPLEKPADIQHARDLIARGPGIGGSIVVADIAAGPDGINRNWTAEGRPLWNWHVTGFLGFADMTIEILDGWPTYVAEHPQEWMNTTGGRIGFWSYTVTAELPSVPEPGSLGLLAGGAAFLALRRRPRADHPRSL